MVKSNTNPPSTAALSVAVVLAGTIAMVPSALATQPFKGKIVKLDNALGKVTLTHGAIPKLDMPSGMTMSYRVENKAQLDGLKPGDQVTFDAHDDGGSYTIVGIEKAK